MSLELFTAYAEENKIDLTDLQLNRLSDFMAQLIEKNKVMNLTAITEPEQIEIKHFIDSVAAAPIIKRLHKGIFRLIDIGSGAGFPGIPLKIMLLDSEFVLLDSVKKKVDFVNDTAERLSLSGIYALHARAEDLAHEQGVRESFDFCTARALAPAPVLLEYCLPFLKKGGYLIMYKSGSAKEELKSAENAAKILGGSFCETKEFELPENAGSRSLTVVKKIVPTPAKYPRKAGTPAKKPLQ